jgi:hypothetical protein
MISFRGSVAFVLVVGVVGLSAAWLWPEEKPRVPASTFSHPTEATDERAQAPDLALRGTDVPAVEKASITPSAAAPVELARIGNGERVALTREVPPWASKQEGTAPPPPHHVPAWQLRPPPPSAGDPTPSPPAEPPNPATHRPPDDNPGGVNGDRPARVLDGTSG